MTILIAGGGIAFFGYGLDAPGLNDTSTSPEFVLGYLSFLFVSLLMVAQFSDSDALPLPEMEVGGQMWPVTVFGVIAFCFMLVAGLGESTQRAFNLLEQGLLPPRAARRALARLVRTRGNGEGRPWVPHSVEYDDLFAPHTSIRQRYVSDHSPSLVALFNT